MTDRAKSNELFERAKRILAGGVNSPVRAFKAVGGTPIYMDRGEGAYLYDVDGNRYLDFCCSWGPLILGHAHPIIVEAISSGAMLGTSFGTVHENEIHLAEKIIKLCPHIEKLRFVSSGTEAVMSAVRLARGFTGRDKIIKFSGCYHGHGDYLLVSAGSGLVTFGMPSSAGVPVDFAKHTLIAPVDDKKAIEELFNKYGHEIAAVLIEPIPANNGLLLQSEEYLKLLRDIAKQNGTLLIFDEVISGFRVAPGGACEFYGVVPDLCTYGKIVGGGLPVGAFGGRTDIMDYLAPDGPVYQAGTLSGNPLAMICGWATLELLEKYDGWNQLDRISKSFVRELKKQTSDLPVNIVSIGSMFWICLQEKAPSRAEDIDTSCVEKYARIFNKALDAGIYLAPSAYEVGFLSTAHTEQALQDAAGVLGGVLREVLG